jgi:hypothetical protein
MRSPLLDPARTFHAILGWGPRVAPVATSGARAALRWASHHSGLPMVLVAAIAVVLSWRLIKRTLRLAVEVLIALVCLVAATRMGWLTW